MLEPEKTTKISSPDLRDCLSDLWHSLDPDTSAAEGNVGKEDVFIKFYRKAEGRTVHVLTPEEAEMISRMRSGELAAERRRLMKQIAELEDYRRRNFNHGEYPG